MSDLSLRSAAERTRSAAALLVPWFTDLTDGTGRAEGLAPELRFALMLATADRARELGTVLRAELSRAREAEESERLGSVRALLERHRLLAEEEPVPQLAALATRLGKFWFLALDMVRSPEMAALAEYAYRDGVELPERPFGSLTTAIWDKFLAEVIVALDPHGSPLFMGQSVSRHDLTDFLGTGSVFVDLSALPGRALESRLRDDWADKYSQRAARLFASGVMTVYAVLPGQAELRTLDELWHEHARSLNSFFGSGRQFWSALLLRCIGTPGLADEVGELAARWRADPAAVRRTWFARFVVGRSLVEDLAIVMYHDRAVAPRGCARSVGRIAATFLIVGIAFFSVSWVIGASVVLFDSVRLQTVVIVATLVGIGSGLLGGFTRFESERRAHHHEDWALRN